MSSGTLGKWMRRCLFSWTGVVIVFSVAFFPVLFLGRTQVPHSILGVVPGGNFEGQQEPFELHTVRDPVGVRGANYPDWEYAKWSLLEGVIPFWNPYQGLGQPLLAEFYPGILYPVNWLHLGLPASQWDFMPLLQLLLLGFAVYWLARELGTPSRYAFCAAAAIYGAGCVQLVTASFAQTNVYPWIPMLWFALERANRCGMGPLNAALVGVSVFAMGTAGHPSPVILGIVASLVYSAIRCWQSARFWKALVGAVPWAGLGALLAAPAWLTFLEYVLADTAGLASTTHLPFFGIRHLPTVLFPYAYGMVNQLRIAGVIDANLGDYWGWGWFAPPLSFLALAGCNWLAVRVRHPALAVAVAALSVGLWSFGVPPVSWLSDLPFLGRLILSNYGGYVPAIGASVICGVGACHTATAGKAAWRSLVTQWTILCGAVFAIGASQFWPDPAVLWQVPQVQTSLHTGIIPGLGWAVIFPAGLALLRAGSPVPRQATSFLCGAGLVLTGLAYAPVRDVESLLRAEYLSMFVFVLITAGMVLRRVSPQSIFRWDVGMIALGVVALFVLQAIRSNGLYSREDPFRPPPFIHEIQKTSGEWRSYGIGGYLIPNYSSSFRISSLNNLGASIPSGGFAIYARQLDPNQFPSQFYGADFSGRSTPEDGPRQALRTNRKFYNHAAVRYVVGRGLAMDLTPAGALSKSLVASMGDVAQAAPVPIARTVNQPYLEAEVPCARGAFDQVEVLFGTSDRINLGQVVLQAVGRNGKLITADMWDSATARDNAFHPFNFASPICTDPTETVRLRLFQMAENPTQSLAAWRPPDGRGFVYRLFGHAIAAPGGESRGVFAPTQLSGSHTFLAECPRGGIVSVSVFMSTYARLNPGTLTLVATLFRDPNRDLGRASIDSATLVDNAWADFRFAAPVCGRPGERVALHLKYEAGSRKAGVAIWVNPETGTLRHQIFTLGETTFRMTYRDVRSGAEIWEDLKAQPRAYIAPLFSRSPDWQTAMDRFAAQEDLRRTAFGDEESPAQCPNNPEFPADKDALALESMIVEPNRVTVRGQAMTAGTLVLVDTFLPGWAATVNQVAAPVFRINGNFRGVCIAAPGPYEVRFSYQPPWWNVSLVLFGLGIAGTVVAIAYAVFQRRHARKASIG